MAAREGEEKEEEYRPVAGIAVFRDTLDNTLETAGDNDDIHSIQRKPSEKLYLLVKKPRSDHAWQFPQGGMKKKKKETVAQAALRELSEECGNDIKVELIDSEPVSSYQYRYPPDFVQKKKRNFAGSKVQFVRAKWISGQCKPDGEEIIDFAWLTRSEVLQNISSEYKSGIQSLLSVE